MKSARIPVQLQEPSIPNKTQFAISNRLTKYAAAAGATLAGATTGQTAIIFWDLSEIPEASRTVNDGQSFLINLDASSAEGVIHRNPAENYDFTLSRTSTTKKTVTTNSKLTGYAIDDKINRVYTNLTVGDTVDSSAPTPSHSVTTLEVLGGSVATNVFSPGSSGYLGVQFFIGTDTHYGWVHLTITDMANVWVRVDSVAYNTIAGEGITIIPEPGTVGLLATGAAGLLAWRARRRAA